MSEAISSRPRVNGILETSLYVERLTRSAEFYQRVFGFELIDPDQKEGITDETRLCAMHAGDRNILLLFKKGATANTDATGRIRIAFAIARRNYQLGRHGCRNREFRLSPGRLGDTAARRFTSATPMVICWRWSRRVYGASTDAVPRISVEMSPFHLTRTKAGLNGWRLTKGDQP
jgi:catechol 2,3-dioxygenase-like lactoylglutathione lyase family enzyme